MTEARDPLVSVEGLTVRLHGQVLLDDVSVSLAPGETLALTGESGSGKSLTALSVMRLLPDAMRAEGRIRFDGQDLLALSERRLCRIRGRDIGMVFQEPMTALNPLQTVGRQISETLRQHGRSGAREETARLMEKVGLTVPPGRFPHELSGGQRQRVVIAMAIACKPRLLIADEPTTALDVTTQAQILELLKALTRAQGMALMMITHDLAVVSGMADRIAVMQDGRVVETAPTRRLFAAPAHGYTRALMAASAHRPALPERRADGPLLDVEGLTCTYALPRRHPFARPRAFSAVKAVSLAIARGERVGLVGESGCGKSTLARALLGLTAPAAGRITLGGREITASHGMDRATRARVQAVFQDPYGSFNPRHRVARLLTEPFHLSEQRPSRTEARAAMDAVLTQVGLKPEDARRHIHAFSGGQRQRLAIARALIVKPELILFDEAVSALDVRVRARILDLIAEISRTSGLAWLFISHDLSVVRGITDRVLVMRAGEIVEQGPTERLFTDPQHPYTQRLLAATPRLPDSVNLSLSESPQGGGL